MKFSLYICDTTSYKLRHIMYMHKARELYVSWTTVFSKYRNRVKHKASQMYDYDCNFYLLLDTMRITTGISIQYYFETIIHKWVIPNGSYSHSFLPYLPTSQISKVDDHTTLGRFVMDPACWISNCYLNRWGNCDSWGVTHFTTSISLFIFKSVITL